MVLIQYHYPCRSVIFNSVFKKLSKKNVKVVALVHDLDILRFERPDEEVRKEIGRLNSFQHVISHNPNMSEWLVSKGLKKSSIDLEVFDYRMSDIKRNEEVNLNSSSRPSGCYMEECSYIQPDF